MTKTKLMFAASPDADHGYVARVFIDGKPQPIVTMRPHECEITIEAPVGTKVGVAIAAITEVGGQKVPSQAKTYNFVASNSRLPIPPGDIFMHSVIPELNVIDDQPTTPPVPDRIMISGHPDFYDGSMGEILGYCNGGPNSNFPVGVITTFPMKSRRVPEPEGEQFTTKIFYGDASLRAKVIKKDHSIVELVEHLKAIPEGTEIR